MLSRMAIAAALISLAIPGAPTMAAEKDQEYARWPWPTMVAESSDAEVLAIAKNLHTQLNGSPIIGQAAKNPTCCLWLEVTGWTPNPGQPGYVIVIQPGGGTVTASDNKQLGLAVDKLKSLAKHSGEKLELPVGLITNYPLVKTP